MYQEEQSFTLRFSLEASFPDDYDGEQDRLAWLREWEAQIKPEILKQVFETIRRHHSWRAHVRNRGIASTDEIEIVLSQDWSKPQPFRLSP